MTRLHICRQHRAVKKKGHCPVCKRNREKIRYWLDPYKQRARKLRAYYNGKLTGERMPPTTCTHDDAMQVEEEDLAAKYQGESIAYFFCPDFGHYIDESGNELTFDPTQETVPQTQKKTETPVGSKRAPGTATGTSVSRTQGVPPKRRDQSGDSVRLEQGDQQEMFQDVSGVSPEPGSGSVLPTDSSTSVAGRSGKNTKAATTQASDWGVSAAQEQPGPWNHAACPNLELGCVGMIETYHTLVSQAHGNSYFMRCPECSMTVVLEFKTCTVQEYKR